MALDYVTHDEGPQSLKVTFLIKLRVSWKIDLSS